MATFKYSAKDIGGKTIKGRIDASTQADAIESLRKQDLIVLKVSAGKGAGGGASLASMLTSVNPASYRPRGDELVVFTRQMSTMLSAGIPMLESLEILCEQAENQGFAGVLDKTVEDIRGGTDLSTAFSQFPKCFSDIYVAMIRAGEVSGQIDTILIRLAEYMEASEKLKREIKAAMTYPVVSLVMVIGITMFLMLGIVPKFKPIFDSMEIDLPALTAFVLGTAEWMENNIFAMMLLSVGAVVGYKLYRTTEVGKRHMDWFSLHAPVFGALNSKVALSRFAKTFATLIKSGVPILGALEIVSQTVGNVVISDAVDAARENVRQGEGLAEPLGQSPEFPPMVVKMIGIGERSGALEQLLEKISEFYDEQVSAAVKALTSLIEPLLIGIMGFMVGSIVLAVFLPIFEIQKKLAEG